MKHKKGFEINSTMVGITVVVVAFLLLFMIIPGFLKKSSGGALDTIKKWAGHTSESDLEKQKEDKRVNEELISNAVRIYSKFENEIKGCLMDESAVVCKCATVDFLGLSNYALKISNTGSGQVLEIIGADSVPITGKSSNLGNFYLVPVNPSGYPYNAGEEKFYMSPYGSVILIPYKSITFSKESFKVDRGYDTEKSKNHMDKLNFIRIPKGTLVDGKNLPKDAVIIDETDYSFSSC